MADYNIAHKITADFEGGYANDKDDSGGETMFGITRKNFPNWPGWAIVDKTKAASPRGFIPLVNGDVELKALAKAFYKQTFWDCFKLDAVVSQAIANEMFDSAVNLGKGRAALWLQRAINVTNKNGQFSPDVKADGIVGPATIAALNAHKRPGMVLKALNTLQGAAYIGFAESNPTQEKFMESWLSRVSF